MYTSLSASLANSEQWSLIIKALGAIQKQLADNVCPDEIATTIDQKYSFLSYLKQLLPRNFDDIKELIRLTKYLLLAIAILMAVVQSFGNRDQDTEDTHLQNHLSEALQDIVNNLTTHQAEN